MSDFWVKVLGGGTSAMTKDSNPAGYWVKAGKINILMDAGYGVLRRMVDEGLDYQDVNVVTVSHFHADHATDVFPMVFARFVQDSYYERISKKGLKIIGQEGTKKNFEKWRSIFWRGDEVYPMEFVEKLGKTEIEGVKIGTFEVKHVPYLKSIGVRIEYKGKVLVYTGDVGSDHQTEDLVRRVDGADLLITEASYEHKTANHFTFGQIEELREKAKIRKVLVGHVSPTQSKRIERECGKDKELVMAKDGMKIKIE